MSRIVVARSMNIPVEKVWGALADLASHTVWMKDALELDFRSDQTTGVGTSMDVKTRIGPFTTMDVMEVTSWHEGRSIGVAHRGLVTGEGTISCDGDGDSSTVTWDEELLFPWWLGGGITGFFAKPVLEHVWKGNLARLESMLSDL